MTPAELGKALKCELFGERRTIQEAFDFATEVARASDNPPAVMTAVFVVANTIATKLIEMGDA